MFSVIIHNVRSILNVGAIFRIADGAGVDRIYLTGYTPGPDTHAEKIAKTALGADRSVSWERVRRVGDLARRLKEKGVQIVGLEQSAGSIDYRKLRPKNGFAVIVGNEVEGVTSNVAQYCDVMIEIPMRGQKESLNVAVAFGIAAYELTRRKK